MYPLNVVSTKCCTPAVKTVLYVAVIPGWFRQILFSYGGYIFYCDVILLGQFALLLF